MASSMKWSADGRRLVCGPVGGAVRVWDVPTGKLLLEAKDANFHWLDISASGRYLVSARRDRSQGLQLWDLETATMVRTFADEARVLGIALMADERRAICTCIDGKVRVYDVATGMLLKVLAGHKTWSYAPAISPDERYFATGGIDSSIFLWDGRVLPNVD